MNEPYLDVLQREGSCSMTQSEIIHHVWGPDSCGYCKGYGLGMAPTDLYGSSSQNPREEVLQRELEEQRLRNEEQKLRHEEQMAAVQEKIRSEMQAEVQTQVQAQVQAQFQAQLAAFMQQMMMPTQPPSNDSLPQVQVGGAQMAAFMQMMRGSQLPQETLGGRVG